MRIFASNMVWFVLLSATAAYIIAIPHLLFIAAIGSLESGDSWAFASMLVLGIPGLALIGLWAMGMVAIRLISGRPPRRGKTANQ